MDFFLLDIRGDTFILNVTQGLSDPDERRAQWTKEHLHLLINRDGLPNQRRLYYGTYIGDIENYVKYKHEEQIDRANYYRDRIRKHRHITVFREMQRQWRHLDRLRALFEEAPELQAADFAAPDSVPIAS